MPTHRQRRHVPQWPLQNAKNQLSEVIAAAGGEPQADELARIDIAPCDVDL